MDGRGSGWADASVRLPPHSPTWAGDEFREELAAWVSAQVGPVARMEQVKLRPWATVWCVETATHRYFAKQNCALQAGEAALLSLLAEVDPHRVVPLTAVDLERGLLLTPDQGRPLSETAAGDDLDAWTRVLTAAAVLQRDLLPHADRVEALGLAVIAPGDAPAYVERRVAELGSLPASDPMALATDARVAVEARLPDVRRWAEQVAALGLPLAVNHNDLHENNVFHVDDELRFFDLADAVLTEPLGVLLIPLNVLAGRLATGPDDPRLWAVAEPVLEVWSDLAPVAALRAALPAALQLARLPRLETWVRCCASMTDEERAEWGSAAAAWLGTLAADPPLGVLA